MADLIKTHLTMSKGLHQRMQASIPWGMRRILLENLIETVVSGIEEHGQSVLGLILAGEYKLVYEPPATFDSNRIKPLNKDTEDDRQSRTAPGSTSGDEPGRSDSKAD